MCKLQQTYSNLLDFASYEHTNTPRRAPTTGRKSWHKRAIFVSMSHRQARDVSVGGRESGAAD
jgi:hypothetical protein